MDLAAATIKLARAVAKPLTPKSLRDAVRHSLKITDDAYFRTCSPATAPELAHCLFELHQAGSLEGRSYYEFGLFRGYALWFVQELTKRLGVKDFHCHGFDSFRGLPEPTGIGDEGAPWHAGKFAVSRAEVESYLGEFKSDFSRLSLHEGFFSDALFESLAKAVCFAPAALILVDCDLYSSTVPALKFVYDHVLIDGTIVLFDDYNCFNRADDRGQRRALAEFLREHPDVCAEPLRPFGWHGQGFYFRRGRPITP